MDIKIINKLIKKDAELILVSNYFVGYKNEVVNWYFNKDSINSVISVHDFGVWKIKQLKK